MDDVLGYLPLSPQQFQILLALSDGDRHGYGIILEIAERTAGSVRLGTGTLYTALAGLVDRALIVEPRHRPAGDERRRYYRLTTLGRAVLEAETARLDALVKQARRKGVTALGAAGVVAAEMSGAVDVRRTSLRDRAPAAAARAARSLWRRHAADVRGSRRGPPRARRRQAVRRRVRRPGPSAAPSGTAEQAEETSRGIADTRHPVRAAVAVSPAVIHHRRGHHARARHRRHDRRLHGRQRRPAPAAALPGTRSARAAVPRPQRPSVDDLLAAELSRRHGRKRRVLPVQRQ